ncbi:FxSxx-COOH system tetratricopeptide repeat protein [Kitasatospora sp. NPDC093806]|uniref:FxSxx-COOH system tetratricopeptide repeat protein n=1 Tax=Kitasatospora sp. NPDC093806 TaxID=3155075 RepID=UPI003424E4EF
MSAEPPSAAPATWQSVLHSGSATAGPGGTAVSGILTQILLPPEALRPPALVDAPDDIDNLPLPSHHFVGRERDLDHLDAALHTPGAALVQAVSGLGGIGKSTLAAYWAATRPHGCRPVRWLNADGPAGVQKGLADLATALQPTLGTALSAEQLAEYALQWLASHTGWLLVLDNVNDPADIATLVARAPGGRFLITSRLATVWTDASTLVRLDTLSPDESLALLTGVVTVHGPRELDGAAELCAELGHLPLAVHQAAAYLAQSPFLSPRDYLALLAEDPHTLYAHGGATTPADRTIARIWRLTLDQLHAKLPHTTYFLRALAWFAPDRIPVELVGGLGTPAQINTAIGLLAAYGMITLDPETGTLSVHRLVQALARTPDPADPHRTADLVRMAAGLAAQQLSTCSPEDPSDPLSWPTWRTLLPHVQSLAERTPENDASTSLLTLLSDHGSALDHQGLSHLSVPLFERSLPLAKLLLADGHREIHSVAKLLGSALSSAGTHNRALELLHILLRTQEEHLGPDDPTTGETRRALAVAYLRAGIHHNAVPLLVQCIQAAQRIKAPSEPTLLALERDLAHAYQLVGDHTHALTMLHNLVPRTAAYFGNDDPRTFAARHNLATTWLDIGDYARAIPLLRSLHADRTRILGRDHPSTLTTEAHLGAAYQAAGNHQRAVHLFRQAFDGFERVLGIDHPTSIRFGCDLADALVLTGEFAAAVALYRHTLDASAQHFGCDHPEVEAIKDNLARTVEFAERRESAR